MGKEPRIDPDLLAQAEAAGVEVEAFIGEALRAEISRRTRFDGLSDAEKARKWAEENAEAIKAHREQIEKYGVFGEDLRTW